MNAFMYALYVCWNGKVIHRKGCVLEKPELGATAIDIGFSKADLETLDNCYPGFRDGRVVDVVETGTANGVISVKVYIK